MTFKSNLHRLIICFAVLFCMCSTAEQVVHPRTKKGTVTTSTSPPSSKQGYSVSMDDLFRYEVAAYGKQFLGSKYKYGGKTPSGFDCSGFTYFVFKKFDIELIPVSREQAKMGNKIALDKAQTGDLIFFGKGRSVNHVGLVVSNENGKLEVIHSTSRGVIIDDINQSSYWKPRIISARSVIPRD